METRKLTTHLSFLCAARRNRAPKVASRAAAKAALAKAADKKAAKAANVAHNKGLKDELALAEPTHHKRQSLPELRSPTLPVCTNKHRL